MKFELIHITTPEGENKQVIQGTDSQGMVWSIPSDPANTDYQEYLAQLEAENN
jgi:hypothetical protein